MGIGSKVELLSEIIRSLSDRNKPLQQVMGELARRPMVLGSDISAIAQLAKKFGFIEGEDDSLGITRHGLEFMKYVDSISRETSELASPTDDDYITLDKLFKDAGTKYKETNKEVFDDIQEIRSKASKYISSMPEPAGDYELLLTASMPPGLGMKKIPSQIADIAVYHDEAIKRVVQDTTGDLFISSPFLELAVFKLLVGNLNAGRLDCKLIISDEKLINNTYNLKSLKSFLKNHFGGGYEIRYLRKHDMISHAKVWLSEKSVHITSANILANSHADNFELGIYSTDSSLVKACRILVAKVWEKGEVI